MIAGSGACSSAPGDQAQSSTAQQILLDFSWMSALPPKADMCSALADVRFGPKADMGGEVTSLHFWVSGLRLNRKLQ